MMPLYPLRFEPMFRRYLWGGRKLADLFDKPIGDGEICAESWEVCDHGADQSIVACGPARGRTLGQLVHEAGDALLGRHAPQAQFPLLYKFLDARLALSVQVHPDDARAQLLAPTARGKTEAWVVVAAEPESWIYAGLKRGFDRPALEREISRGTAELCLHRFQPRVGDCIFVPAGTVHAIGAGLVVAEIQQSSDITWRLYDWNRVDATGAPRQLHVAEALDAIDFAAGPVAPVVPAATNCENVRRLVACEQFMLDRRSFDSPQSVDDDDRFHILSVLSGEIRVSGDPSERALRAGDTTLLPARRAATQLVPTSGTIMLDAYLP